MNLKNILAADPTLDAADRALEAREGVKERRQYLGMSQAGDSCQRKLWYLFRWCVQEVFDAATHKRFLDGHASEAVQAERLRMVAGVTLDTLHPVTGQQFRYSDHEGHFSGHCDGKITGILQAPKTLHIWEAKSTADKKLSEFRKIKADLGEKATLKKWNPTYYAQAQLYMHYEGTDRHYLTVSSPGVRDWDSCRTEYDAAFAIGLKAKAKRIITSQEPLDKVSNDASWFECRYCPARGICHEGEMPDRTCRTCAHSTPVEAGAWHCSRWGKQLTAEEQQNGCPSHAFLPSLVPGEVIDSTPTTVTYRMPDGSEWMDGEVVNA